MKQAVNIAAEESRKNTAINEIGRQNQIYLEGVKDRMNVEYMALERSGNKSAVCIGDVIRRIVFGVVDEIDNLLKESARPVQAPYLISQIMQSVNTIISGGVISPLTGDDSEWRDITVPEDVGQKFKCEYRGKEFYIGIESVQINVRYPKIYRLNGDNRFAHRIDFMQFHDVARPGNINLTEDSIRFIQFPYSMNSIHSQCIVDEDNNIKDYLDYEFDEITNGLVYTDQSADDPNAYIIAPKIPFHMLEEAGINVEEEIAQFISSMQLIDSNGTSNLTYDDDDEEIDSDLSDES